MVCLTAEGVGHCLIDKNGHLRFGAREGLAQTHGKGIETGRGQSRGVLCKKDQQSQSSHVSEYMSRPAVHFRVPHLLGVSNSYTLKCTKSYLKILLNTLRT